jgi:hypothetical protein
MAASSPPRPSAADMGWPAAMVWMTFAVCLTAIIIARDW